MSDDDQARLAAILIATPEALAVLLQLPEGAYIDSVHSPHDQPGTLHLRVRGAGWPVAVGGLIPRTVATVTRSEGKQDIVDWHLPSHPLEAAPST